MIERDKFRRRMGETAAQAPDDPDRRALEQCVAEEQTWAEQEWRDLLLENECLRNELPQVSVPDDLESRLLVVADKAPRRPASVQWGWSLAAAAVVLILLGVGARNYTTGSRVRSVALLAIDNHLDHLDDHHVSVETPNRGALGQALSPLVAFDVTVPDLGGELQLVGGRKCKLGAHVVAFSLWQEADADYSLFQFQPDDFGLSGQMPRRLVRGARIWCEDSRGYVLVGDPGKEIDRSPSGQ